MKRTVLAIVVGMLLVGPALAQTVPVGGDQQQRNTEQTTTKTTKTGPGGEKVEQEVRTNKNLPATGKYDYSGLPCKWFRGTGGQGGIGGQEKK